MNANDTNELDYDLEITKVTRKAAGSGTWVCGTLDGEYRFDALVVPEHADDASYELGTSRISKLWIARLANKETVFNFDRGLDVPAVSPKTEAVVEFLCEGLADLIYR